MKRMLSIALLSISFSGFAAQQIEGPEGHWGDALVSSGKDLSDIASIVTTPVAILAFAFPDKINFPVAIGAFIGNYGINCVFHGLERPLSEEGMRMKNRRANVIKGLALTAAGALIIKNAC